jgi:cation diffusion facilitator family transporter
MPQKKNWENNLGYIEGWVSVVVNTVLFVLKYTVGISLGSVSMMADAWHTLSDTLTSLIVIIGFWISARPADEDHPFGHGRAEAISAVIIGTLLGVVGFSFLRESVARLQHHQAASFSLCAIVVFSISLLLKEALARFSIWAGRRIKAQSLIADGWHHRSDAIASGLIVAGALAGRYFWWIDGVLGIGVALLILYAAYDVLRGAAGPLLGQHVGPEIEKRVQAIIARAAPVINDVHHVHFHTYGGHTEVTMHLRLPSAMHVGEAHHIADTIEQAIRRETHIEATVHIDPVEEPYKD